MKPVIVALAASLLATSLHAQSVIKPTDDYFRLDQALAALEKEMPEYQKTIAHDQEACVHLIDAVRDIRVGADGWADAALGKIESGRSLFALRSDKWSEMEEVFDNAARIVKNAKESGAAPASLIPTLDAEVITPMQRLTMYQLEETLELRKRLHAILQTLDAVESAQTGVVNASVGMTKPRPKR